VVNYVNSIRDKKYGIASNYLANGINRGENVGIFVVNFMFALPTDIGTSIIMVGPGTGIAPFRDFCRKDSFQK
jgi:sulfite reductase alpha subunit-like flavoprotein